MLPVGEPKPQCLRNKMILPIFTIAACDHLAVAALVSPGLVEVFKREAASQVYVLEDLNHHRIIE